MADLPLRTKAGLRQFLGPSGPPRKAARRASSRRARAPDISLQQAVGTMIAGEILTVAAALEGADDWFPRRRPLRSRADSPSKTYAFRRAKFRDVPHAPPTSETG